MGFLRLWGRFGVLLLLDSHHVEGIERGKHGATNPSCILSVQGGTDSDLRLRVCPSQIVDLLIESLLEVLHQSGTTSENDVVVKVYLQVGVHLLN